MAIVKAILKSYIDKGKYKIVVFGDKEYVAFDAKLKEHEGKEVELDTWSKDDKHYCGFPKQGGFQKGGGGFSRGKSDKELYLSALTMAMSYSKDVIVAMIAHGYEFETNIESTLISGYKKISQNILADLKAIEGEAPKQEAPKTENKPPVSTPQSTSAPKAPYDPDKATVKQKLEHEAWQYLRNTHSDSNENFKTLLISVTEFPGKNKETGEPTGKMVYIDDINDKRLSDAWAGKALGKLRELVDEEDRKAASQMGDINY